MTDYLAKMREHEAEQAKKFHAIALAVAAELGAQLHRPVHAVPGRFILTLPRLHPDATLYMRFAGYREPEKVRVGVLFERTIKTGIILTPKQVGIERTDFIGVSFGRGAKVIAREIERRLLNGLPEALDAIIDRIRVEDAQNADRNDIHAKILQVLGKFNDGSYSQRTEKRIYEPIGDQRFDAEVNLDGSINLDLRYVPADLAIEIARLMKQRAEQASAQ